MASSKPIWPRSAPTRMAVDGSGTPRADDAPGCDAHATDISTATRACRPLASRVTSRGVEQAHAAWRVRATVDELRGRGVAILDELLDPLPASLPGVAAGALDFARPRPPAPRPGWRRGTSASSRPRGGGAATSRRRRRRRAAGTAAGSARAGSASPRGAAEVEALVGPQLARRVLADVALALAALGSVGAEDERRLSAVHAPQRGLARSRGRPRPRAAAPARGLGEAVAASRPRRCPIATTVSIVCSAGCATLFGCTVTKSRPCGRLRHEPGRLVPRGGQQVMGLVQITIQCGRPVRARSSMQAAQQRARRTPAARSSGRPSRFTTAFCSGRASTLEHLLRGGHAARARPARPRRAGSGSRPPGSMMQNW